MNLTNVQQAPSKYRETQKFSLWAKLYTDKSNTLTWGNATQSAIAAYGYTSKSRYHLASITGSKNMRKYEFLASSLLENMGFTYVELLKIGLKKVIDGSYRDWENFMERLGYFDCQGQQSFNQYNQFNMRDITEEISRSRKGRGLHDAG